MKKRDRHMVYLKYGGKCAYCGRALSYEEMQVDHIVPKRNNGKNNISNYNPSCRRCNHYKRACSLEVYRKIIKSLHERVQRIYIVKVAIDYGIIKLNKFDGVFYFERETKKEEKLQQPK